MDVCEEDIGWLESLFCLSVRTVRFSGGANLRFSIASLVFITTVASLLMLAFKQQRSLSETRMQILMHRADFASIRNSYLESKAQLFLTDQIDGELSDLDTSEAEANFQKFRVRRLMLEPDDPRKPMIVSVPQADYSGWHYIFHVYLPSNLDGHLMADVFDRRGKVTRKANVFLPAAFDFKLPSGHTVIEINCTDSTTGFLIPQSNVNETFHVKVWKRDQYMSNGSDGVRKQLFEWKTLYQQPERSTVNPREFHEPAMLFRSRSRSTIFSAAQMLNRRSADSLRIFVERKDD